MLSKFVRTAPRLLQLTTRLNQVPAVQRFASNQSAPVIESDFKPSGHVPNDESHFQVPVNIDGQDWVAEREYLDRPYPLIVSLDEISIEKKQAAAEGAEEGAAQEQEQELEPEFQVKTLEDKIKVWFGADMPTKYDDQRPERDLVNFPRLPPNLLDAPPTRLYFLPESWFKFFEPKTGRTGGYVFATTFWTFLISKEIFCYNDNAHSGLALFCIALFAVKKFGKQANDWATSTFLKEKQGWIDWQHGMKQLLNSHVQELKQIEERSINPGPIYDAKRENVLLQQEAEYRRRLMEVYNEVKRKLDYQVAIEEAKKNFTRKHLVNWVIDSVNKSVNTDLEKAVLKQCVLDLKTLSEKRRNAI